MSNDNDSNIDVVVTAAAIVIILIVGITTIKLITEYLVAQPTDYYSDPWR